MNPIILGAMIGALGHYATTVIMAVVALWSGARHEIDALEYIKYAIIFTCVGALVGAIA